MQIKNIIKSRIGRNSIFSILDQILSIGMNLILAILFAKFLGPYSFGQYSLGISLVGVIAIFSNFGILPILKREIAKSANKTNIYLGNALGIKVLVSFPLLLLITMFIVLVLDYSEDTIFIIFLIAIYNTIISLISYVGAALVSLHRNDVLLKLNVTNKSISLIFAFVLLTMGSTLDYLLYTFITISTLVFIYSFYEIKKIIPNFKVVFNPRFNKKYILISFPLVLASAAEFINLKVDTIFIGSILDEVSTGYYSAAYSIFMGATFIPLAMIKVFFPNFVDLFQNNKKDAFDLLNKYKLYFIIYSLTIGLIFYFFSKTIILLIFGDEFNSSVEVLQLLSFALFAIILNRLYNYVLVALKQDKYYFKITLIGTLFNVSLNFFLIPLYGIVSAALATFITEFVVFLLAFIKINRIKKIYF